MTPSSDPLENWPSFVEEVWFRMETGRVVYGDRSFSREPAELASEVEEALLDVAAWSFILWTRVRHVTNVIKENEVIK